MINYDDDILLEDEEFGDFDDDDLIEARVREAQSLDTDLAAHLRRMGIDAKVVLGDLNEDPAVSVYGLLLTADEASELFRRLSPIWNGQSCERSWEVLSDVAEEEEKTPAPKQPQKEISPSGGKQPPPKRSRRLGGFPRRRVT